MEGPLLSKSDSDSSSNDHEHIVDMTADEQTPPHEAEDVQSSAGSSTNPINVWNLIEFVLNLVQIVAAIVVVTRAKDEHAQVWIVSYTCGCIATLPILVWRFWQHKPCVGAYTRLNEVMDLWSKVIEYLFVGWVVLLLWYLTDSLSSLDNTTQHFWLCVAFLAFSFIRYVIPKLLCATMGLCFLSKVVAETIMEVVQVTLQSIFVVFYMCFAADN